MWDRRWKEAVHEISSGSVAGGDLLKNILRLHISLSRRMDCMVATEVATRGLIHLVTTIKKSMADHFLGPKEEEPVDN
jgi:hypothetical protein